MVLIKGHLLDASLKIGAWSPCLIIWLNIEKSA